MLGWLEKKVIAKVVNMFAVALLVVGICLSPKSACASQETVESEADDMVDNSDKIAQVQQIFEYELEKNPFYGFVEHYLRFPSYEDYLAVSETENSNS